MSQASYSLASCRAIRCALYQAKFGQIDVHWSSCGCEAVFRIPYSFSHIKYIHDSAKP